MKDKDKIILADLVDFGNMKAIFAAVKKIFLYHYDKKLYKEIEKCYKQIRALFEGKYAGYNACNTRYHDLRHTMNVFLAAARLLDGYNIKENKFPDRMAVNLLKSCLLHDTGYIQEKWDNEGTGAKHILNHIGRSIAFVVKNKGDFATSREDIDIISKLIRCTEISCRLGSIPFHSDEERTAGMIFGTAYIIGQMSDREYVERLLFLYNEMKEAGVLAYSTEFDIIKGTPGLYNIVRKRLNSSFKKMFTYAEIHFTKRYDIAGNLYIEAMEKNIEYIEKIINDSSSNFRSKLKRGNYNDYK